ncbi:MAG: phenylalanine--tRNA ligase subunit beta [Fibrobacterales bacterium]|nr:phenylalanine--tRNA ligase subunit beta [Fibrobacterales bacterium]
MKVSLNWLRRLLPGLSADVETVSRTLTSLGLEVEGIEDQAAPYGGLVVGKVRECGPHPDSDHLHVTKLFDGKEELQVVCGAPNVAAGQTVVFAPVGCSLPMDGQVVKLKKAKLRGVESFGMICGEDEIGLGTDHSGILLLDDSLEAGTRVVDVPGLYDVVFEINVTPNRPDALSHVGVARELGAALGLELVMPEAEFAEAAPAASTRIAVEIEPGCGCGHYVARVVDGVKVGPSPVWMQRLLRAVGLRPISNVVDVTNFVLMELGQPLHAFDAAKISSGKLRARRGRAGEVLRTLDGQDRKIGPEDLLICDGDVPACAAGVMGGADTEVTDATTSVALESAWFEPAVIRRQAKRIGLSSDSSYRFERGVDPLAQDYASRRAASLLASLCGGTVREGSVEVFAEGHRREPLKVSLRHSRVKTILGYDPGADRTASLLEDIGLRVLSRDGDSVLFEVPGWRPDLEREIDLIEEVARLEGYDKIPTNYPSFALSNVPLPKAERVRRVVRRVLAASGLDEGLSLRFESQANLDAVFAEDDPRRVAVKLLNPLSENWGAMSTSPIPRMFQIVSANARNGEPSVRFFEATRVFAPSGAAPTAKDPSVVESDRLAMVAAGEWGGGDEPRQVDFFDLKGIAENLFRELGVDVEFRRAKTARPYAHPHRHAELFLGGRLLGELFEAHPAMREKFEFDALRTVVADLDFDMLAEAALPERLFAPFSRFGAVPRDISLLVDERVDQAEVFEKLAAIKAANRVDLRFVSSYVGKGVPEGKRNLLYQSVYQSRTGSLTDDEVNKAQEKFIAAVEALGGIEVRK